MLPVDFLTLLAFIPAGLALNLTPGADMMFCLGQGLRSGRRAAMAANFGIAAGGMVHATLAALGLGALVAAHPAAFEAIRWLGVAYLLWLAMAALRLPLPAAHKRFAHGTVAVLPNAALNGEPFLKLGAFVERETIQQHAPRQAGIEPEQQEVAPGPGRA